MIVDVARLVSLIAGPNFFGKDFGQRKAGRGPSHRQVAPSLADRDYCYLQDAFAADKTSSESSFHRNVSIFELRLLATLWWAL
jgi:hypothetical protein